MGVSRVTRAPQRSTLAVGNGGAMSYLAGSDLVTYAATALRRARPAGHRSSLGMSVADVNGATYDVQGRLVVLDGSAVVRRGHARSRRPHGGAGSGRARPRRADHAGPGATCCSPTTATPGCSWASAARAGRAALRPAPGKGERRHGPGHRAVGRPTDHRSAKSLYLTDAGSGRTPGRLVEISLAATPPAAVAAVTATLVRSVPTSAYSPPSPDPSGIGYLPDLDRFVISDGEVEEMTIFAGVNLFETTRAGTQTRNGVSQPWSNEPTGVGYNPATRQLLGQRRQQPRDLRRLRRARTPGTAAATTQSPTSTLPPGATAIPRASTCDPVTGSVWVADGVNAQVYRYRPGPDGTFGTTDDLRSNFDVGVYGAVDPEGHCLRLRPRHPGRRRRRLPHDLRARPQRCAAQHHQHDRRRHAQRSRRRRSRPGSANPGARNYYVVARGIDNDNHPDENDGKLYELAATLPPVGPGTNQPPVVSAGTDQTVTLPGVGEPRRRPSPTTACRTRPARRPRPGRR